MLDAVCLRDDNLLGVIGDGTCVLIVSGLRNVLGIYRIFEVVGILEGGKLIAVLLRIDGGFLLAAASRRLGLSEDSLLVDVGFYAAA